MSPHLSSGALREWQSAGRDFEAVVTLAEPVGPGEAPAGVAGLRSVDAALSTLAGERLEVTAVGTESGGLFELQGDSHRALDPAELSGLVIGPDLADTYRIAVGQELSLRMEGSAHPVTVTGVARNADLGVVYLLPVALAELLDKPAGTVNGYLMKDPQPLPDGTLVLTRADRNEQLAADAVSNRMSAVINQVLAVVFGGLLLVLVLQPTFQDATRDNLILRLLGMRPRQITLQRVSIFRPVITIGFVLAVPIALWACHELSRSLSIQTGDYIPFQGDPWAIALAFCGIRGLYLVVEFLFLRRVRRIVRSDSVAVHL